MEKSSQRINASLQKRPSARRSLGQHGERLAEELLVGKGFTIVARNWRSGKLGEFDLIAIYPTDLLVFVEVKTRRSNAFGSAAEAVTLEKQQRMMMLAERYLQGVSEDPDPRVLDLNLSNRQVRFDVIAILQDPRLGGLAEIEHIENAFS